MRNKEGMTLFEVIIVSVIIAVATVMLYPNFTTPQEQAKGSNASHNLLTIYTAEQNYNNDKGSFCTDGTLSPSPAQSACQSISPNCGGSLAALNCNLSLNIQDDNTYTYDCTSTSGFTCAATRITGSITLSVTNKPIQQGSNPLCTPSIPGNAGFCPYNI